MNEGNERQDIQGQAEPPEVELSRRLDEALRAGLPVNEVLPLIKEVPEETVVKSIRALASSGQEYVLPLLARLARGESELLAVTAAESLGHVPHAGAARLLTELGEEGLPKVVRKTARKSLHRLRSIGISFEPETRIKPEEEQEAVRPVSGKVSHIDGAGNRMLWLVTYQPFGTAQVISVLTNDLLGIKDLYTYTRPRQEIEGVLRGGDETAPTLVEAPADYVRQLIAEARELNRQSGHPLPKEYHAWRQAIGTPKHHYERPIIYEHLSTLEVRWDPNYLQRSPELLQEPEMRYWFLDTEDLAPYLDEISAIRDSRVFLPDASKEAREEAVINRAALDLFGGKMKNVWKRRLEEMAYLFLQTGRGRAARMALAAAVALEDIKDSELSKHPLARALVTLTIDLLLSGPKGRFQMPSGAPSLPDIIIPR